MTCRLLRTSAFFAVLLPAGAAAQGPPLERILGRYEGRLEGVFREQEFRFDLRGRFDGSVRLTVLRRRSYAWSGTYDAESGVLRLKPENGSSVREFTLLPGNVRIAGEIGLNAGTASIDIVLRDNGDTRKIREDYAELVEEWAESADLTFDDADGDRQECFVVIRWMQDYRDEFEGRYPEDARIATLTLLADDRFVPVFEETFPEMSRGDRNDIFDTVSACRREHIPQDYQDGQNDAWDEVGKRFYARRLADWVLPALEEVMEARGELERAMDVLRSFEPGVDGFWMAFEADWESLGEGWSAEEMADVVWAADRARFEDARAGSMKRSAEAVLTDNVDRMIQSARDREERWRLMEPSDIEWPTPAPEETRPFVSGRTVRFSMPYEDVEAMVEPAVRDRQRSRLHARLAEMEAEAAAPYVERAGRLGETDVPFYEGSRLALDIRAERFSPDAPIDEAWSTLRARRAADFAAVRDRVVTDLARAPTGRAVRERISSTFVLDGDRELAGAAHLIGLAEERAELLDWLGGWYCARAPGDRLIPTAGGGTTPYLPVCAAVDHLLQTYLAVMKNEPGADGEMGRLCGALNQGPVGGLIAAFCESSGMGGPLRALFRGFEVELAGLDVQACAWDENFAWVRRWRKTVDGTVYREGEYTVAPEHGGGRCTFRATIDLRHEGLEALSAVFTALQEASRTYGTGIFVNSAEGLMYVGTMRDAPIRGATVPDYPPLNLEQASSTLDSGMSEAMAELIVQAAIGRLVRGGRRTAAARMLERHCGRLSVPVVDCLSAPGGGAVGYTFRWLVAGGDSTSGLGARIPEARRAAYERMIAESADEEQLLDRLLTYLGVPAGPPEVRGLAPGR